MPVKPVVSTLLATMIAAGAVVVRGDERPNADAAVLARPGTGERVSTERGVQRHGRRLVVLATGDSLVRAVAFGLADRLRRRRDVVLRYSIRNGTGLSKPCCLDWIAHARVLVERWHPDVVLVFLGGNDGYDVDGVPCCSEAWVARFAERQRALMQVLGQGGRAHVYWASMPAPGPRQAARRMVWAAENRALALASADGHARVFDVNAIVSPGFRYRRAMRWRGRWRVVRRPDQIHLSLEGGCVVSGAFLRRLRADAVDVPAGRVRHARCRAQPPAHKRRRPPAATRTKG